MRSNNIWNSTMQNGLILGIIFSANFIFSVSNIGILALLSFLIPVVVLVMTYKYIIKYRETDCGGAISYSHGLFYTILLFFFAALISAVVKFVYFRFINPEFLVESLNQSLLAAESFIDMMDGKLQDTEKVYESIEAMNDSLNYTMMFTWMNVVLGFFVGLIMAGIAKKDKSIFDDYQQNN